MAEVTNSKLLKTDTGIPKKDAFIVLVKTEWNAAIVDELEKGCRERLEVYKVKKVYSVKPNQTLYTCLCKQPYNHDLFSL